MSIKLMSQCWEKQFEQRSDREVMLVLCDHANDDGICWPSRGLVSWKTDLSETTLKAAYKRLKTAGALEELRESGGRGSVPILRVVPSSLSDKPPRERGEPTYPLLKDEGGKQLNEGGKQTPPGGGNSLTPQPSVEPSVEPSGVEANASSGISSAKPQNEEKGIGLEKHITDRIYEAMKANDTRLPNEHYTYHLGRAKDMLAKDSPTDEELDELPNAFVRHWILIGRTDAPNALNEYRRQHKRGQIIEESRRTQGDWKNGGAKPEIDEETKKEWARQRAELAAKEHEFLKGMGLVK